MSEFSLIKQVRPNGKTYIYPNRRCKRCEVIRVAQWVAENRSAARATRNNRRRQDREAALDHYGRKCACCGETEDAFLQIDHIDGGGRQHLKQVGYMPTWLRQNSFPTGFQTLCANCNHAKGMLGQCPHAVRRQPSRGHQPLHAPVAA